MSIYDHRGFKKVAEQSLSILKYEKGSRNDINAQIDRSVNWPVDLKTNIQRLVSHSEVKLLPNVVLEVRPSCINESKNGSFCFQRHSNIINRWHDLRYELFMSKYRSMKDFVCVWPIARHYGTLLIRTCENSRCAEFPLVPELFRLKILTGNYSPNKPST